MTSHYVPCFKLCAVYGHAGISAALSQLGWWGGIILLGEIGPVLISSPLKTSGTFYLLSGACLMAFLHVLLFIPETKVSVHLDRWLFVIDMTV